MQLFENTVKRKYNYKKGLNCVVLDKGTMCWIDVVAPVNMSTFIKKKIFCRYLIFTKLLEQLDTDRNILKS